MAPRKPAAPPAPKSAAAPKKSEPTAEELRQLRIDRANRAASTFLQEGKWYECSISNEHTLYRATMMVGNGGAISTGIVVEVVSRETGALLAVRFIAGGQITPNVDDGGETVVLRNLFGASV